MMLLFLGVLPSARHLGHGGRHTVFWVGRGPPKNFFGWAIMHLDHPKNSVAKYSILIVFNACVIFFHQLPFGFHCPTDCDFCEYHAS
jgi:hypothetical protein